MKNSKPPHARTGLLIPINPCILGSFLVVWPGVHFHFEKNRTVVVLEEKSDSYCLASLTSYLACVSAVMALFSPALNKRSQFSEVVKKHRFSHQLLLQLTCSQIQRGHHHSLLRSPDTCLTGTTGTNKG